MRSSSSQGQSGGTVASLFPYGVGKLEISLPYGKPAVGECTRAAVLARSPSRTASGARWTIPGPEGNC